MLCVSELGVRKRGRRRRRDHDQQAWEEEREGAIWRRGVGGGGVGGGGGGGWCFSLSLSVGGRGKQLHKNRREGKKSTFFLSYTAWYNMGKHCFETISAKECLSLFEVSMKLSLHSRARQRPPQKQCPPLLLIMVRSHSSGEEETLDLFFLLSDFHYFLFGGEVGGNGMNGETVAFEKITVPQYDVCMEK